MTNTPKQVQQITEHISTYEDRDDDTSYGCVTYSGPVAEHIVRLEGMIEGLLTRIEKLEAQPVPNAEVQAGSSSIDTRPGLSVSDVVELSRALRNNQ